MEGGGGRLPLRVAEHSGTTHNIARGGPVDAGGYAHDPADIPNVTVIARFCDNSRETQALAEAMVAAYNAARQCNE